MNEKTRSNKATVLFLTIVAVILLIAYGFARMLVTPVRKSIPGQTFDPFCPYCLQRQAEKDIAEMERTCKALDEWQTKRREGTNHGASGSSKMRR